MATKPDITNVVPIRPRALLDDEIFQPLDGAELVNARLVLDIAKAHSTAIVFAASVCRLSQSELRAALDNMGEEMRDSLLGYMETAGTAYGGTVRLLAAATQRIELVAGLN